MHTYATKKKTLGLIIAIVALSLTTVLFVTLMAVYVVQRDKYRTQLENAYQKAYFELVSNVNNLEVKLSKLLITSGLGGRQKLLADISRQADEAEYNLSELPLEHESIEQVSGFINQLNGYSSFLLKQVNSGGSLNDEHYENIGKLYRACKTVGDELYVLTAQIEQGYSLTSHLTKKGRFENPMKDMLGNLDKNSVDYPELIFDGPFSEALENKEIRGLTGNSIAPEEGESVIRNLFDNVAEAAFSVECRARYIEAYSYDVKMENGETLYIQLTRRGGRPILISAGRACGEPVLTRDEAVETAESWAKELGFGTVKAVWYCDSSNYATVNLAPLADGIVMYPDLIKIKVALDTGEILGLEATHYYYNHTDRRIVTPKADTERVKREISDSLEIVSERLAVIPIDGGREALAYEIAAEYEGMQYFIYVDALTGREIDVYRVIDTEQGQLLL